MMSAIYYPVSFFSEIPEGYQAVVIPLDAAIKANLDWKKEKEWASHLVEKGLSIFWELRLGLFSQLPRPLSNKTQFLSLGLSLEHFLQGLWETFHEQTIGVSLYKGDADFSKHFPWEEEYVVHFQQWLKDQFGNVDSLNQVCQTSIKGFSEVDPRQESLLAALFCRNAAADYLDLLAGHMSQILPLYLLLDASATCEPALQMQLLHKERFPRFELGVKGSVLGDFALNWNNDNTYVIPSRYEKAAICLPSAAQSQFKHFQNLGCAVSILHNRKIPFRIIPEDRLTQEWDELDVLFILPDCISVEGKRKLMGFCAAGGQVVSLGNYLGVPHEISFQDWSSLLT